MIEFVYPHTHLVAGVDEVGRGPLVGAVVTAAVILDPARPIIGLNDSKKLSEKRRLALFDEIKEKALSWSLGRAEPHEIDELNILHATMLAMQRAVAGLKEEMEFLGPVKMRDVEAAQTDIVSKVRALEETGEIVLSAGTDDVII